MNFFTILKGSGDNTNVATLKKGPFISNPTFRKVMRVWTITMAILTVNVQLFSATTVEGQNIDSVEITLALKNESLVTAFKKIEAQSPFHFMYRNEDVKNIRKVSAPETTQSVAAFLKHILATTTLSYRQIDQRILITQKETDSDMIMASVFRDSFLNQYPLDIQVAGRVSDEKGEGIPGANITIKGSSRGTTTDTEGRYVINAPEEGILVFSFIGFETQELQVNSRSVIDVTLKVEIQTLSEVVVTALNITRETKDLTYSVQSVKGSEINQAKDVTSMINTLQGKVAGMTITKGNDGPGSATKILLRGNRSITSTNEPLYVTDGVPSNIGLINGDNIESITVLKGASAAALYGSAGQNGAIIITTKRAAKGQIAVDYSGSVMLDRANLLGDRQYEYGQGDFGVYATDSERSWGPRADGQMITLWNGRTAPFVGQPDRHQDFFRTAATLSNTISINGGMDKTQTFFSYGNIRAQGITPNNEMKRHTFDLKVTNNISEKLSVQAQIMLNSQLRDNNPMDVVSSTIARAPITIPLSDIEDYKRVDEDGNVTQNYWRPNSQYMGNPYYYMYRMPRYEKEDRVLGIFVARYKFAEWVDFQLRGSLGKLYSETDVRLDEDYYGSPIGSDYHINRIKNLSTNFDALLSFKRDLSTDFYLSGYLGGSIQESKEDAVAVSAGGLYRPNYFYMTNAENARVTQSDTRSPQVQAIYGLASLAYKDFLFAELTARNDWSSALPKGNQSYFYPSFGLNGILSEMTKFPAWVSYAKARTSLAYAGYGGRPYLDKTYYPIGPGGQIITPTIQTFDDFKPEMTTSLEVGTEWQFLAGRLGFDFTFYSTETKNQLLLIGAPSASLYDQRYINAGLIRNNGIEIVANVKPATSQNFLWNISMNYAKNNNEVVAVTDEMQSVIIGGGGSVATVKVEEGAPYGEVFVKAWRRDDQGRRLVSNTGAPLLTSAHELNVGNFNPNYKIGLSNSFQFKNLLLSFLIDYQNGGIVISSTEAFLDADGLTKRTLEGRENGLILDAYLITGEKNEQSIPAQNFWGAVGDRYPTGEFYTYSATNMRLRELVIGYSISPKSSNGRSLPIKSARISIVGRNLFFLKKHAPFDPEVTGGSGNSGGLQSGWLPATRTYGVNINLSF